MAGCGETYYIGDLSEFVTTLLQRVQLRSAETQLII